MNRFGAIILTGGRSNRMGSDKALLTVANVSFLERILQTVSALTEDILIVGEREVYKSFGYPVLSDKWKEHGPAAGIQAGLAASSFELNLVLACDLPLLKHDLLLQMLSRYGNQPAFICRTTDGPHPLTGLYQKEVSGLFERQLKKGVKKMMAILEKVETGYFDVPESLAHQLTNVNTKEEYESLLNGN